MELARAVDFAADQTRGVLLTVKPNGRPHASNVVYAVWDGRVHVSVTADRVKTRNLRNDARASLHVTSSDFWKWVVLEGDVHLSEVAAAPGDEATGLLRRVYESVSGPHPDWDEFDRAMISDSRLAITLQPANAYGQLG